MSYQLAFKKPEGLKYTDMCIYIDNTIYKEYLSEEEESLIYQYIYHVCYVLACKAKYFRDFKDYNEFALFAAGKVYLRLVDERQFLEQGDSKKLEKVKSVLNYIKITLYGMKVDYQKQTFREIIDPEVDPRFNPEIASNNMKASITCQYRDRLEEAMFDTIKQLPHIIKRIVMQTPYKTDPLISRRLYISCLISFLKSITLSSSNVNRLKKRDERGTLTDEYISKIYQNEKDHSVTLWHLEENMYDYVKVLCNKIRKKFCEELIEVKRSFQLTDEVMEAIMLSANEASYVEENFE